MHLDPVTSCSCDPGFAVGEGAEKIHLQGRRLSEADHSHRGAWRWTWPINTPSFWGTEGKCRKTRQQTEVTSNDPTPRLLPHTGAPHPPHLIYASALPCSDKASPTPFQSQSINNKVSRIRSPRTGALSLGPSFISGN